MSDKKIKARLTLNLDFEEEFGVSFKEQAKKKLAELIADPNFYENVEDKIRIVLDGNAVDSDVAKPSKDHKKVIGEFHPSDVLDNTEKIDQKEFEVNGESHVVKMRSHRYYVFRVSRKCAACGLEGTKMLLEQHPTDKNPHFNLYAVENGMLILMTKDHIHAKSWGGQDVHSNYQTMCTICNNLKGNTNLTLESVLQLRTLYNENIACVPRKQLSIMISDLRDKLKLPNWDHPKGKKSKKKKQKLVVVEKKELTTKSDVLITHKVCGEKNFYLGVSFQSFTEAVSTSNVVACIKAGTKLTPTNTSGIVTTPSGGVNGQLEFDFNDGETFRMYHGLTDYADPVSC